MKQPNIKSVLSIFCPSNTFSFVLVALGAVGCHTVHSFVHSILLADVHCVELGWFKASSFWYTINTGPSPKFLSDILLLLRVMEILRL